MKINALLTVFISLFLLGCGGGGGSSSIDDSGFDSSAYTGLRTDAVLDSSLARQAAEDYLFIKTFVESMIDSGLYTNDSSAFQSGLNETENCSGGGQVNLITSRSGSVGISKVSFLACIEGDERLNGNIQFEMNYQSAILNVSFNKINSTIISSNVSYMMDGGFTFDSFERSYAEVNLLETSNNTNEQVLIESLILPISTIETEDWTGNFYYSDKGKVSIDLVSPFSFSSVSNLPVGGGQLVVSDVSGNKATFESSTDEHVFIEFISSDETISPQFVKVPWSQLNVISSGGGEKPIAAEYHSRADNTLNVSVYSAEKLPLNASISSDSEGALLSFSWKIVGSPVDSNATLSNSKIYNPVLNPDYPGEYIVELIVSDGVLDSDPLNIKITVGEESRYDSFNPSSEFGRPYAEATQPGGEILQEADIGVDGITGKEVFIHGFGPNISSKPDYLKLKYEWSLSEIPDGSTVTIPDNTAMDWSFIPDKSGEYIFDFIVENGFEVFTNRLFVTVYDYNSVAFPIISRIEGNQFININQEANLTIGQYVNAGPEINQTTISIVSKPDNSSPQTSITNDVLAVILDKKGKYEFSLVASNGIEESIPRSVILYAVSDINPYTSEINPVFEVDRDVHSGLEVNSGDLNQDGVNDLVMSWTDDETLDHSYQLFYGQSDESYEKSIVYKNTFYSILDIDDFNNDGKNELVSGLSIIDIDSNGIPTLTPHEIAFDFTDDVQNYYPSIDLNNDGKKDMVWTFSYAEDETSFIPKLTIGFAYSLQEADYNFSAPIKVNVLTGISTNFNGASGSIKTISFDKQKSVMSVVVKDRQISSENIETPPKIKIEEFKYSFSGFTKSSTYELIYPNEKNSSIFPFGRPRYVDFDNDNEREIIGEFNPNSHSSVISYLAVWKKNEEDKIYELSQKIIGSSSSQVFDVSDMNADGNKEIILYKQNTGNDVSILYQNESGNFDLADLIKIPILGTPPNNRVENNLVGSHVTDIESDGDNDILFQFQSSNEVRIIRNTLY